MTLMPQDLECKQSIVRNARANGFTVRTADEKCFTCGLYAPEEANFCKGCKKTFFTEAAIAAFEAELVAVGDPNPAS